MTQFASNWSYCRAGVFFIAVFMYGSAAGIIARAWSDLNLPIRFSMPYMSHDFKAAEGCELVLVLGGDGTFLRAADLARKVGAPVLGINLGHVGFLAEGERSSLENSIQRVIDKSYRVE